MATYRKVKLEISRINGYGQYIISANYKGKIVTAHTTDSEAFDYLNNDIDNVRHNHAKRHCYYKIVESFNS